MYWLLPLNINPLSSNMVAIAQEKFANGIFEDTAYFEPFYLKEFVGTKPKSPIVG